MSVSETGEGEEIEGFDPKHDDATTPSSGRVKQMYQKLQQRNETEAAEELRRASPLSKQQQLRKKHPVFDPKHDDVRTSSRGSIRHVWEWLTKHGHTDDAADLRTVRTLRGQTNEASRLRREYDIPPLGGD